MFRLFLFLRHLNKSSRNKLTSLLFPPPTSCLYILLTQSKTHTHKFMSPVPPPSSFSPGGVPPRCRPFSKPTKTKQKKPWKCVFYFYLYFFKSSPFSYIIHGNISIRDSYVVVVFFPVCVLHRVCLVCVFEFSFPTIKNKFSRRREKEKEKEKKKKKTLGGLCCAAEVVWSKK